MPGKQGNIDEPQHQHHWQIKRTTMTVSHFVRSQLHVDLVPDGYRLTRTQGFHLLSKLPGVLIQNPIKHFWNATERRPQESSVSALTVPCGTVIRPDSSRYCLITVCQDNERGINPTPSEWSACLLCNLISTVPLKTMWGCENGNKLTGSAEAINNNRVCMFSLCRVIGHRMINNMGQKIFTERKLSCTSLPAVLLFWCQLVYLCD